MAPVPSSPAWRAKRLRSAIALAVASVVGIAVGYAYSWEPDEEAYYQRAAAAQEERVRNTSLAGYHEWQRRQNDSVSEVQALNDTSPPYMPEDSACGHRRYPPSASVRCAPVTLDGVRYTPVLRHFRTVEYRLGMKSVFVYDDSARLLYEEDLTPLIRNHPLTHVKRLGVRVLEDPAGAPRAFFLTYVVHHSNGLVEVFHRIVAPRADSLQALTRLFHYGDFAYAPRESEPGPLRLREGNRLLVSQQRLAFQAFIPYRVDLGCEPGGPTCIAPAVDSIAGGLLRYEVDPMSQLGADWQPTDTAVTVEMFDDPSDRSPERVTIRPGTKMQVLGGAGWPLAGRTIDHTYKTLIKDDWLHIRVNGRTGWIRGPKSFAAIAGVPRDP